MAYTVINYCFILIILFRGDLFGCYVSSFGNSPLFTGSFIVSMFSTPIRLGYIFFVLQLPFSLGSLLLCKLCDRTKSRLITPFGMQLRSSFCILQYTCSFCLLVLPFKERGRGAGDGGGGGGGGGAEMLVAT